MNPVHSPSSLAEAGDMTSAANGAALVMLAMTLFFTLSIAAAAWVIWRRSKRHPSPEEEILAEIDEEERRSRIDAKQKRTVGNAKNRRPKREHWERDPDWWKKGP